MTDGFLRTYASIKEVAELFGLSEATIYRHAIKFGGVKAGGKWRFDRDRLKLGTGPVLPKGESECHFNEKEVLTGTSSSKEYANLLKHGTLTRPAH